MEPFQQLKLENSRLLREDVLLRREVFRSRPEVISLHTTDVCNLRCVMCARSDIPGTHRLERATLARVCSELFPFAQKAVVAGAQGEPLLADFDVILEEALRTGVKLDLVTNGSRLTVELYRDARDALSHVNVSIDGPTSELYERIRAGGQFADLCRRLAEIADERRRHPDGVLWSASAVVMRSNLATLPEFVRTARRLGMDAVVLQALRPSSTGALEEDPLGPPASAGSGELGCPPVLGRSRAGEPELLRHFELARAAARESGINLYFGDFCLPPEEVRALAPKVGYLADSRHLCWAVARNVAVMPDGSVYPCCHPTDHLLGNVRFESALAIWNGRAARALRRAHFSRSGTPFCSGCVHAPYLTPRAPGAWGTWVRRVRMRALRGRNLAARVWAARRRTPFARAPAQRP